MPRSALSCPACHNLVELDYNDYEWGLVEEPRTLQYVQLGITLTTPITQKPGR
jgi:hypothetical protein